MSNDNNIKLDGIDPRIYARRWNILATLCTSLLLVSLGNSSLNLALPTIARDLQLSSIELTWIVDIYSLVFASLLFTTSAVADRYGRKLVMQMGLVVFLIGTIYAGFVAKSGIEIILSRGIMGIGAAMVMPTTLSIIDNIFPRHERTRAIAIWSGIAGGGIALGSIASGFLLEHYSWQSVFVFSTMFGFIALMCNQLLTPSSRDEKETPVDWLGGLLSTAGLLGIVYGIIEAPSHGLMNQDVLVSLTIGVISMVTFVWWQFRTKHPMLDMKLFYKPAFSIAALSVTLAFFALMGVFFSMSQVFQLVIGYGPMESSFRTLPLMLLMMIAAPFVPNVVKKFGTRWTVTTGLLLIMIAFLLMSRWPVVPAYWQIIGSMVVMMSGMALTMTPSTNMLMSAVPRNRAGMGSAMNDTTRELGGSLGIAVLGAVLASTYSSKIVANISSLTPQMQAIAESSLAGALTVTSSLGPSGKALEYAAKEAWMGGLSNAMLIATTIVAIAAVIAALWLPHRHVQGDDDELLETVIES